MTVVLPTCKAHIVAVTGDEYPTKKEYDIFCLKMILAFPSLKDPDTDHGYVSTLSLFGMFSTLHIVQKLFFLLSHVEGPF